MEKANESTGIIVSGVVSKVGSYISKKSGETFYSVMIFVTGGETLLKVDLDGKPDPKRFEIGKSVRMLVFPYEKFGNLAFKEG